jgi:hypothetical protein
MVEAVEENWSPDVGFTFLGRLWMNPEKVDVSAGRV